MERIDIAVIGGGAAGLVLANALPKTYKTLLFERGERVGRKLSATGNGQGNLTNLAVKDAEYFSVSGEGLSRANAILRAFDDESSRAFFASLGVLCSADERGRVYPCSRQASSLTDALRFSVQDRVRLQTQVVALEKTADGFTLTLKAEGREEKLRAQTVVLCAGGKAAKNFGTDGSAYALATALGHTVTPLYPSLVQLKASEVYKTLKGIRVSDCKVAVTTPTRDFSVQGDIIFTDYGVSGDSVFRLTAFIASEIATGRCKLALDFLPDRSEGEISEFLRRKQAQFPELAVGELLFGVVNNQIGRVIMKLADGDIAKAAKLVKSFPLQISGSLGFDYAQVTKGGIPLSETTEELESRLCKGLYFAGEILDIDGQCGGFNLQWAYSSARAVAQAIAKRRG